MSENQQSNENGSASSEAASAAPANDTQHVLSAGILINVLKLLEKVKEFPDGLNLGILVNTVKAIQNAPQVLLQEAPATSTPSGSAPASSNGSGASSSASNETGATSAASSNGLASVPANSPLAINAASECQAV